MPWTPPDQQVDLTLQRIITRAREEALNTFNDHRRRIEREQSAKGVMGGAVFIRSRDAADQAIRRFGARVVPELLDFLRDVTGGTPPPDAIEWIRERVNRDVFICHASEDKADVAEPLAVALERRGFRVWLDKFEIRIGDRILSRIDDGLHHSRFGAVIISQSFFGKQWSQMELNALAALEASAGRTKILPIWHKMTHAQVEEKSPLMAAVRAANTKDGIEAIADEIAAVLRESRGSQ